MKIVHVVAYYPPHVGGMENCVREISEGIAEKGNQVEVFTSDIGCKKDKLASTNNLKIHYLKSWEIAHTTISPSLFFKLLKISRDSVIHLHVAQVIIPEIVFLVSKIKKIPYIAHVHADVEPSGKMGFLLPFYKKVFLQRVLNSASKVIVPTAGYIGLISKKYAIPETKIDEIPYGVNPHYFKSISNKMHDPIRLLFVGRFAKQKNVPLLLNAFKLIIEKKQWNIELNIVGDGEEKNKIIAQIKEDKLEEKVVLHGALRGEKLYEIYSNSDIFILSSVFESFGIVLIEAMASGLPIIASDILAVRDVIEGGKTGLLAKTTPRDFAEAIEKLLNNSPLREELGKNALEKANEYTWARTVQKFENVYSEVMYKNNKE
jgi:glycosyltransferase involved in cell wall biosynthesis